MRYDFDRIINRKATGSIKWSSYPEDVLPLWVADMDFASPDPVVAALVERTRHGVFGYTCPPNELKLEITFRMQRLYGWQIQPEWIVFLGGVVAGFNLACHALQQPGAGLLLCPPVYPPMLEAAANAGMLMQTALMQQTSSGWILNWEAIQQAINPATRALLFCSPHNPLGRVFTRPELLRLAGLCEQHDLTVISDEIHCDLIFQGYQHIPFASLSPQASARTITHMAPSKTFNIPGLGCSFAIVENETLRSRMYTADMGMLPHVNLMGYTAALAAYQHGGEWLEQVMKYLEANYALLCEYIPANLPNISLTPMQGTYLAWLDCRQARLQPDPYRFFLDKARVALNHGDHFGPGGAGFVRLNFACPRAVLLDALDRMKRALQARDQPLPARLDSPESA